LALVGSGPDNAFTEENDCAKVYRGEGEARSKTSGEEPKTSTRVSEGHPADTSLLRLERHRRSIPWDSQLVGMGGGANSGELYRNGGESREAVNLAKIERRILGAGGGGN